jgi:lipooligosaccharide transport system permease protein
MSGGTSRASLVTRILPPVPFGSRRAIHPFERSLYLYRRTWLVLASGFFEPLFYLLAVGFGIGALVGSVPGPNGEAVPYQLFVAPALLASSAMNGAIFEVTFNVYGKLRWEKVYDAMLATPLGVGDIALGEIAWALFRGLLYAIGFVLVMLVLGLFRSPFFLLAIPAAMLIGFAFAAVGMAATTFVRSWQDFDLIQLVILPLVPLLGDVLPDQHVPARAPGRHPADAPVSRRGPHSVARVGGDRTEPPGPRRVPGGDGRRRAVRRLAAT